MRRTPEETACDRIRDRLPLLAVDDDDPAPGGNDDERRAVADHLAGCEPCRARRDGLVRAMDALSAAAVESPVDPDAPSLWPALQARIAAAAGKPRVREALSRPKPARPRRVGRSLSTRDRLLRSLTGPVGALAAAALAAVGIGLALAGSVREESIARIEAAAVPRPMPTPAPLRGLEAIPLVVAPILPEPVAAAVTPESADLALLDDPPLLGPDGRPIATSPPATAPAVRFDLDRGVPMPPDARVAPSAY